jgi:hypothetical protein
MRKFAKSLFSGLASVLQSVLTRNGENTPNRTEIERVWKRIDLLERRADAQDKLLEVYGAILAASTSKVEMSVGRLAELEAERAEIIKSVKGSLTDISRKIQQSGKDESDWWKE